MYKSLWRTSFTYFHPRETEDIPLRISRQEPIHTREILPAQLRLLLNHPPIHFPSSRSQWQLSPRLARNVARQSHVLLLSNYICHVRQAFHTFSINAVAKPPSYPRSHGGNLSGSADGTGLFTEIDQQFPVDDPITLLNTAGSSPSFCPIIIASATTIQRLFFNGIAAEYTCLPICCTPRMSCSGNESL